MTDKELLELAALAAGYSVVLGVYDEDSQVLDSTAFYMRNGAGIRSKWNPLTDDSDALRLALKLEISIDMNDGSAWVRFQGLLIQEYWGGDFDPCHRLAIVRAAAAIGQAMPQPEGL